MKKVFIYCLKDPLTLEIRYVGKTIELHRRLACHWSHCDRDRCYRNNWIRSLKRKGLKPIIEIIEETSEDDWPNREIFWIAYYKNLGYRLTNSHAGGEGGTNPSPQTRLKMSQSLKGRVFSKEHRQNLAKASTGHVLSKESREKISAAKKGRKLSKEHIQKLREASTGRTHTDRSKKRMSDIKNLPIMQLDLQGNVIQKWDSATVCAHETGFCFSAIRKCCNGVRKRHKGFMWKNA